MTGAVLFVCAANRCRSPLAMGLLQTLVQETPDLRASRIESAGLQAIAGLPATAHTLAVAQEAGIDLSQHRSRNVDAINLAPFDLILTLEQIQAEALASAYPQHAAAIHPFSTIVNLRVDIEDPTGFGLGEHRALRNLLVRYLRAGLPHLQDLLHTSRH